MNERAEQQRFRFRSSFLLLPIFGALVAATVAVVASMFLAVSYSSTAVLLLHETTTEIPAGADLGLSFEPSQIVATNIEVIESSAVLQQVVEVTQFDTVEEVRRHFSAIRAGKSDIVRVVGTIETAEGAQRLTNAIVESYVEYLRDDEIERISAEIEAIESRIAELETTLLTSEGVGQNEKSVIGSRIDELSSRAETRRIERDVANGGVRVIDPGNLPVSRSRSVIEDALIGGFLGFTIGMGVAILLMLWPSQPRDSGASRASGRST